MPGILVIAPHADDEVLGVGGTLARAAYPRDRDDRGGDDGTR